jgi:hypothetical protein
LLQVLRGFELVPELPEQIADVIPQVGIVGLETQGVAIVLLCVLKPAVSLQHRSEAQKVFCLRCLMDSPPDPLNGGVGLLGVKTEHAQQMERIGVLLVLRQRLLATQLGLGDSSRSKMREARLAEGGWRRLSGLSGRGGPALSAIHDGWTMIRSSLAIEGSEAACSNHARISRGWRRVARVPQTKTGPERAPQKSSAFRDLT